ncbi:MAG: phosphatidylglycerophosphatase A [Chloroflexota bacterium]|nr:phosphatidylglycerophosphatase A [Chloroflexota bacterium]MDE2961261.1 phosphatidylglycerophosphatase A [Chloroflexota bacterium]
MIWTGWATPDWRGMGWTDRLAWLIGSGFGSGLSPLAPGTAGAAVAAGIYCVLMVLLELAWPFAFFPRLIALAVMIFGGAAVGVWATGRMSTADDPDPGSAVWDEFVGMWISLIQTAWATWHLPTIVHPPWWPIWWVAVCFFAFRAFDTLKPWPCRRLEDLHGGWGIMLDDIAAGLWALAATAVIFIVIMAVNFYFASPT